MLAVADDVDQSYRAAAVSAIPGTSLVYGQRGSICFGATANLCVVLVGQTTSFTRSAGFYKRKRKIKILVKGAATNHATDGIDCFASKRTQRSSQNYGNRRAW